VKKKGVEVGLHYIPLHFLTYYKNKYSLKINNFPTEELGNKDTGIIGIDADFVNLIREG